MILGISVFGSGIFISKFREEYGWRFQSIALGVSLRSLEQGVMSPITGYFADRLGPRRVSLVRVVVIGLSLFVYSQARTLPIY